MALSVALLDDEVLRGREIKRNREMKSLFIEHIRGMRPKLKAGMSEAEARNYGTLPPMDWLPPRPPGLSSALRGVLGEVLAAAALPPFYLALRSDGDMEDIFQTMRRIAPILLQILGIELHVEGRPPGPGVVVMWNQESHVEHLALPAAIPVPIRVLYNIELSNVPLYGELLRRTGNYMVNRHDEAQWRASISRAAKDIREQGVTLLISPEGTRSWDGKLLSLKRGGFMLAIEAQAPILPVTVVGGYERLPRTALVVRPGPMWVIFGEPIETRGKTEGDIEALQAQVGGVLKETKALYKNRV